MDFFFPFCQYTPMSACDQVWHFDPLCGLSLTALVDKQWHWPPLFFFAAGSHSEGMGKDSSSMGPHSVDTSTTVSIITSSAHRKKIMWACWRGVRVTKRPAAARDNRIKTVLEEMVIWLFKRLKVDFKAEQTDWWGHAGFSNVKVKQLQQQIEWVFWWAASKKEKKHYGICGEHVALISIKTELKKKLQKDQCFKKNKLSKTTGEW